jgi:creatinine amidohydrolase
MNLPSRFWSDLTAADFARIQADPHIAQVVAVLPVAAIEQHGPHLPVSVDNTLLDGVIAAAMTHLAPQVPALFLPTQAIGKSNEHARFPGTLTLGIQTLIQVWIELGECVARTGIRKLLLFNSHGGQVGVMDIVARDLRARHDMIVYASNWFTMPMPDAVTGLFSAEEHRFGIHGGDMETSMMLALRAERVDMARAQDFSSTARQRALDYPILGDGRSARMAWQTQDINVQGAVGNAALASADKGLAVIDASGAALARMLAEFARLPIDVLVDKTAFRR